MKNYKVYLIRDKIKTIVYVGLTSQELADRYWQHCQKRKWNKNDYSIELAQDYLTQLQAVELEKLLIKQYNTIANGFNISPGSTDGQANLHNDEMKKRWSEERKGIKVSPEHAAKNRIARLGKKNSEAHKQRIVEAKSKPVMCLNDGIVYPSARKAAQAYDASYSKISNVCTGKRNSTKGLRFKFV